MGRGNTPQFVNEKNNLSLDHARSYHAEKFPKSSGQSHQHISIF